MQDQDFCRVCRSPGTIQEPLFHPCKCSGSMKFIHQQCLEEWLEHSRKKHCEICKHPFLFTPIYSEQKPSHLSIVWMLLLLFLRTLRLVGYYIRILIVATVWLGWVPLITAWTWKGFFESDFHKKRRQDYQRSNGTLIAHIIQKQYPNSTIGVYWESFENKVDLKYYLRMFLSDAFDGQMIMAAMILGGLALLFLRDYVILNARQMEEQQALEQLQPFEPQGNALPLIPLAPVLQAPLIEAGQEQLDREHQLDNQREQLDNHLHQEQQLDNEREREHQLGQEQLDNLLNELLEADDDEWEDEPPEPRYNLRVRNRPPREEQRRLRPRDGLREEQEFLRQREQEMLREERLQMQELHLREQIRAEHLREERQRREQMREQDRELHAREQLRENQRREQEQVNLRREIQLLELQGHDPQMIENLQRMAMEEDPLIDAEQVRRLREHMPDPMPEIELMQQRLERANERENQDLDNQLMEQDFNVNGDVNQFLDMIGVQGPIYIFLRNVFYMHIIMGAAIAIVVVIPSLLGKAVYYFFKDYYLPLIEMGLSKGTSVIEKFTDPVIEPVIDGLLSVLSMVGVEPRNTTQTVALDIAQNELLSALLGWSFAISVALLWIAQSGHIGHPFLQNLQQLVANFFENILLSIKFIFFMIAELLVFPTACGIYIDLLSTPVLGDALNLQTRKQFFEQNPWTFAMLHWLLGTMFMFEFASYISLVRKIVRPGVLWFIRDPNDPQFNPMLDIWRKPFLSQLRKLCVGFMMYLTIISGIVGGFVLSIFLFGQVFDETSVFRVWPLKWQLTNQLTEIPFDLILFHFILPFALSYIEPARRFQRFVEIWFEFVSRKLCITSFLLGGEYPEEETGDTFMRVPNHDHVEVIPNQKMLVPMHRDDPVFGREQETREEVLSNWTKVYVPPQFRYRLLGLVVLQWWTAVIVLTLLLCVPLLTGRLSILLFRKAVMVQVFESTVQTPDYYSYLLGLVIVSFLLWPAVFVSSVYRHYRKLPRRFSIRRRSRTQQDSLLDNPTFLQAFEHWWSRYGERTTQSFQKGSYLLLTVGFLMPLCLGLLLDLYILRPLIPTRETRIVFWIQSWAVGLILMKIVFKFCQLFPNHPINTLLDQGFRHGLSRIHLKQLTFKLVLPFLTASLVLLTAPLLVNLLESRFGISVDNRC
ncbi:hypothetical protein EDD86DRAFT_210609 [Gorgonomyces haynaldii]|nr:hypothetical protein EDD86DRAFT_210609 [Gorgonomyces haynaldii]